MFRTTYSMRGKPSFSGKGLMASTLKPKMKMEEMEQLSTTKPTTHYNKPNFQPIVADNKARNLSNIPVEQLNLLNNSVPLKTVLSDLSFKTKKRNNMQQGKGVKLNIR